MRIISMEKGDNVKNIFTRFSNATAAIGEVIKNQTGKSVTSFQTIFDYV